MSPLEQTAAAATDEKSVRSTTVSISIIIPALNEERMIGRCLESLSKLDFARDRFEVILVDNGSRDKTLTIAESFQDRLNVRILQKTGVRISALRNTGAKVALGKILAFLDADCLAPADWLDRILTLAPADGAGVLGAHYLLPEDSSWVGRTWHVYQEAPKAGEVSHIPAGDLIMRREDFLSLGGFDETIQTNEDYELCERARAAGMKVRAFPEIGVVHLGTAQSLKVFFRKQAWHGTHVIKVFLRDVFRSHNRKAVFFAAYTFLCLLGSNGRSRVDACRSRPLVVACNERRCFVPAASSAFSAAGAHEQEIARFLSSVCALSHLRNRPRQGAAKRKELLLTPSFLVDHSLHIRRRIRPGRARTGEEFISTQIIGRSLCAQHSIFVRIDGWAWIGFKWIRRNNREPQHLWQGWLRSDGSRSACDWRKADRSQCCWSSAPAQRQRQTRGFCLP